MNPKELIAQLDQNYKDLEKETAFENPNVEEIYKEWLGGKNTDKADHMLYTEYHEVEKMTNSLAIKCARQIIFFGRALTLFFSSLTHCCSALPVFCAAKRPYFGAPYGHKIALAKSFFFIAARNFQAYKKFLRKIAPNSN